MVGKYWKSCKTAKNGKTAKIGHSESILNQFRPLWYENIGKVAKQPKLAILIQFGPLWWENISKVAKQPKLAILNQFITLQ